MARSSIPNTLDYNKQANEIMKGQIDLMGKKVDLIGKEPTGFEAEQELFKNIKAGVEGKRKPAYQTIIEGLINGIQYGMNKKQVEERKEKYGKIANVLNYFEQNAAALAAQNNENMQRENERVKVEPYGVAALELSYSDMPYEQINPQMANLFQQAKLNNPNIKGDYAGYIPKTPNILVRDETGNISTFPLTGVVPEETVKRITQNAINQQTADARTKSANASALRANDEHKLHDLKQEKLQQEVNKLKDENYLPPNLKEGQIALKNLSPEFVAEVNKGLAADFRKIPQKQKGIEAINQMGDIFKRRPEIANEWASLILADAPQSSWRRSLVNALGTDKEMISDIETLAKLSSDLNLDVILGVSSKTATDVLKREIKNANPNGKLTYDGFVRIGKKLINQAQEDILRTKEDMKNFSEKYIDLSRADKYAHAVKDFSKKMSDDMVLVETPNGVGYVPRASLNGIK